MMLIVVLAMLAAVPALSLPSGDLPGTGSTSDLVPLNEPGQVSARSMRSALDRGTRKEPTGTQTSVISARAAKAKSSDKSASVPNSKRAADDEVGRTVSRASDKKDSKKRESIFSQTSSLLAPVTELVSNLVKGLSNVLSDEVDSDETLVSKVMQSLSDELGASKRASSRGAKTNGESQRDLVSSLTETVGGLTNSDLDATLERLVRLLSGLKEASKSSRSSDEEDDWARSSEAPEAKSAGKGKETH